MKHTDNAALQALIRQNAPDELWDVYNRDGERTGKLHRRGDPLGAGEYHLCVHVWMRMPDGRYLLTRRAPEKPLPGLWETTGGCALAGEDSLTAALREVREETGLRLDPEKGEMLFRFWGEHFLCDVWLFRQALDLEEIRPQPGETCAFCAGNADVVRRFVKHGEFFVFDYLEKLLTWE